MGGRTRKLRNQARRAGETQAAPVTVTETAEVKPKPKKKKAKKKTAAKKEEL